MFLKVRDIQSNRWWYVFDVDRIVVSDPVTDLLECEAKGFKITECSQAAGKEQPHCTVDLGVYAGLDLDLQKFQCINCITDQEDGKAQKEYSIGFNTMAFLCTDRGDTVESFFPNGKNPPLKRGVVSDEHAALQTALDSKADNDMGRRPFVDVTG